jgi:hypothetical protein
MTDEQEYAARSQLRWRRDGDAWVLLRGRRRMGRVVPGMYDLNLSAGRCKNCALWRTGRRRNRREKPHVEAQGFPGRNLGGAGVRGVRPTLITPDDRRQVVRHPVTRRPPDK